MNEATLKSQLMKKTRDRYPKWVGARHEDKLSAGHPDISQTANKRTLWVEVKYADPKITTRGIQELTMKKLAIAGFALYVVYYISGSVKRTYLVDPADFGKSLLEWTDFVEGFNHDWVIDRFAEVLYS